MRTSYSNLGTYKNCPLKYKYQEIDKIKAPKNAEQIFGSSIHSALKYMFERMPLYPTLDQILDFFRNIWDQSGKEFKNEDSYYKEGLNILERFYKNNQPWNFNVIDLESFFEVEIEDSKTDERHILAGKIDRIDKNEDGIYEIIDYKTNRRMPSQENLNNDFQMSIYHLGLLRRWPHLDPQKIKLSFCFLKHGEKISTSRDENQLERTKKNILVLINEIKEKIKNNYDFPPTPSGLCEWCGYRQICPMWRHLYEKEYAKHRIKNQEELNGAIREYFGLKDQNQKNNQRLNELKTIISAFMDENKVDRVFGADGYLTKKIQEKFLYDFERIREILEPIGKWEEILSADDKKLEKILSSLSDAIQQKILDLRSKKQSIILISSRKKIKIEGENQP